MNLPRPTRRRHSIVLTSLVDVMFVLLFFFMLAASAVERRAVDIGLPLPAGSAPALADELRLDLHTASRWTLDGQDVAPDALGARLRESSARRVRVVPMSGVPAQALVDALGAVRAAGLELRLGPEDRR